MPEASGTDPGSAQRRYDPLAVARVLLSTGERLIALLGQETALLRASCTTEIAALGAEKTRLSEIFAAGWQQFHGEPGALDRLDPDLRAALADIGRRLAEAAAENEAVLRVGRRAAELVLAAVARAVEAQRPRPTYTAKRLAGAPACQRAGIGFSRTA
jgi:hypothetical protein